jgi:dipeptidyl aminopeptidase/acylaminoacyl peptidase
MNFVRPFAAACAAACGLLLVAFGGAVARAAPLPIEDVLRAPVLASYSPPALSPDNRFLAYAVVDSARVQRAEDPREVIESGVAWYAVGTDIWIADLTTGAHRNITDSKGHNWDASWSPDGEQLAFMADRSGTAQLGPARLWLWERRTGELRQVSEADVREGYTPMQWAGDDHSVLVSLFPQDLGRAGYVDRINPKSPTTAAAIAKGGPQVFEYDPARSDAAPVANQINSDMWLRDLALIDVRTGTSRRLTKNQRIGHYFVAPDRQRIVYSVLQAEAKAGSGQYLFDVIVQDLATAKMRVLASSVPLTLLGVPFAWSPSSDRVTWRSGGPSVPDEIYVASVRAGATKRVARNPPNADLRATFEINPAMWGPDGRYVYFIRDDVLWRAAVDGSQAGAFAKSADRSLSLIAPRQRLFTPERPDRAVLLSMNHRTKQYGFMSVDLSTGASSQVLEETKRYGGYGADPTVSTDGKSVVYVAEGPVDPPDVYLLDRSVAPRKLTNVAPALSQRALGKSEVLEWRSLDGELQRGALIYPADYEAGKAYPLIVKVYGGSSISDHLNLFGYANAPVENLHLYTTRGYALLLADSTLHVGTPMVDLMKSVMPGIDRAVATGVADPQRIGITGHSYGGYSVLSLLVQSPRFKAAVMRAGSGDLIAGYGQLAHDGTNYGLAWAESGQGRMGGSPWDYRERYIENSPIFYLDRVQTPLLIIHGDQDDAVPVYLADEVFTGLRRLGKAVTYARYPGEGHWEGGWSHADRVDALERQIAWFDRFLKKTPTGAEGTQ